MIMITGSFKRLDLKGIDLQVVILHLQVHQFLEKA